MPSHQRCPDVLVTRTFQRQEMPRWGGWLRTLWLALTLWWRFKRGLAPPGLARLLCLPVENAMHNSGTTPPAPPPADDAPTR